MLHALTKHGKLPAVAASNPSAAPRSRWPPCVPEIQVIKFLDSLVPIALGSFQSY